MNVFTKTKPKNATTAKTVNKNLSLVRRSVSILKAKNIFKAESGILELSLSTG